MLYNPIKIEEKWRKHWGKEGTFKVDIKKAKKPYYNLMMFPYPSAEGLHIGNMYSFTGSDIHGRYMRMRGFDVFEPMGFDSFGIHSENFAIKKGEHPRELTYKNIKHFREKQLKKMGAIFDWEHEVITSDPEYYKWTQWLFLQLYKSGLAYRAKAAVDWCPSCLTVLANEQVISGKCERCGTGVIQKELEQWFLKITAYAEKLLSNLEKIDWSPVIKTIQRNWIGKSEGAKIAFPINKKFNYVLLHGFKGRSENDFLPWLKKELEKQGHEVTVPQLPNTEKPIVEEQVAFLEKNNVFDENTILITHSLGGIVALKLLPRLKKKISKLIMVAPPMKAEFLDHPRPELERSTDWIFDFEKIKSASSAITVLSDKGDKIVPSDQPRELARVLGAEHIEVSAAIPHFNSSKELSVLENSSVAIKVFTTRPDTLFGATYMVLAPEHALIEQFKDAIENWDEVEAYIEDTKKKTEIERKNFEKSKTGVELRGVMVVNPANDEEIPVWVADYVLASYGTGAVMAVPAHDQRDFKFATKYKLPIRMVICPNYPEPTCPILDEAYEGAGHLVNSGEFTGTPSEEAKDKVIMQVGGKKEINHHLRDWLISRQRYWGPPIPIIYCDKCGVVPVPEEDLPVELPYVEDFKPTGTDKSPLATVEDFVKTTCPKCKGKARRETDVSDTFLDSAWYFLRYPSAKNEDEPFDKKTTKKWLPVDMYIGGKEHAVLHLMYARFVTMALHDAGHIDFEEPFKKFRAHGLLIREGAKMSKSRGNVISPDEYLESYGADVLRMYLMFLGPYTQGGDWQDEGITGISRFLKRVWSLVHELARSEKSDSKLQINSKNQNSKEEKALERIRHRTIKKVTEDIEEMQYHTVIATLMEFFNEIAKSKPNGNRESAVVSLLKLLAPLAPHLTEELWEQLGHKDSIHGEAWPEWEERWLQDEWVTISMQINGKMRSHGPLLKDSAKDKEEVERWARKDSKIKKYLASAKVKKVIYIQDRVINFVL